MLFLCRCVVVMLSLVSRSQMLVDAGESLVDELGLENLLLVRGQESGEMRKLDANNPQVTILVTKSFLEVDVYAIANNIANGASVTYLTELLILLDREEISHYFYINCAPPFTKHFLTRP